MSNYQYENPIDSGYKEVTIPNKVHDKIFKYRPRSWKTSYKYYLKEGDSFIIEYYNSLLVKLVYLPLIPFAILWCGLANCKETFGDIKREYFQRKYGSFCYDKVWAKTDCYKELESVCYFK